jgi:hypothetical protein
MPVLLARSHELMHATPLVMDISRCLSELSGLVRLRRKPHRTRAAGKVIYFAY